MGVKLVYKKRQKDITVLRGVEVDIKIDCGVTGKRKRVKNRVREKCEISLKRKVKKYGKRS